MMLRHVVMPFCPRFGALAIRNLVQASPKCLGEGSRMGLATMEAKRPDQNLGNLGDTTGMPTSSKMLAIASALSMMAFFWYGLGYSRNAGFMSNMADSSTPPSVLHGPQHPEPVPQRPR